jgi:hypothetical protein
MQTMSGGTPAQDSARSVQAVVAFGLVSGVRFVFAFVFVFVFVFVFAWLGSVRL